MSENIFTPEESEKYAVLRSLYESKNLNFKTDVNGSELWSITVLEYMDKFLFDIGFDINIKDLTRLYKQHKVSWKRKGREEAVKVLSTEEKDEKEKLKNILGL